MARTRTRNTGKGRARSNVLDGSAFRRPIAAGIALDTNPNRGKHGAARLDVLGERESARIVAATRDYRPLTVVTPLRDSLGRRSRSKSRYVI